MKKFYNELATGTNTEAQNVANFIISHILPEFSNIDDIDLIPNYNLTCRSEDIGGYACTVFELITDKYCYRYFLQNENIKDIEDEGAEADFCKYVVEFFEKEQKELQAELINKLK